MRFVVVSEEFPPRGGGVAHFSLNICQQLQAQGRLLSAISIDDKPYGQSDILVEHIAQSTRRRRFGDSFAPWRKANSAIFYLQKELEYRWAQRLANRLRLLRSIHGEFVVWLTYTVHHPELIQRVLQKEGIPYWLLFHGLDLIDAKRANQPVGQWVKRAERVVFNSRATKKLFGDLGFERNANESVCYPGVNVGAALTSIEKDPDCIFKRMPAECRGQFIISSVCRLVRRKGLDLAIQGVCELLRLNEDCWFVIGGDGPEFASLKSLAQSSGLEKRVLFLGQVSDAEKFSLLHHSKLFLMPNRSMGGTNFEGFGIAFAEASLMQTVVVGGRNGGACEAIEEGVTGYLVDADDDHAAVSQIRHLVNELIANPETCSRLASQGRKRMIAHFDSRKTILSTVEGLVPD